MRRFSLVIVLSLTVLPSLAWSQNRAELARDTAILELDVPRGSQIFVGGKDRGTQTKFTFRSLPEGKWYNFDVEARVPGGAALSNRILLQGGWHVRVPLQSPRRMRPMPVIQVGHTQTVEAVAFSPDGRHVLTGGQDAQAILWNASTGQVIRTFQGHSLGILTVGLSPDGRHVLTGANENSAILWDARTGQKRRELPHKGSVNTATFSPDGEQILTGSTQAILWEAATGKKLRTLAHSDHVLSVSFSPDGQTILTGGGDGRVLLWAATTGKQVREFRTGESFVNSVAFSPDGKRMLAGTNGRKAFLWDIQSGKQLQIFEVREGKLNPMSACFSPDGKSVLTALFASALVVVWDAETGARLHTLQDRTAQITTGTFSPDGKTIVTGSVRGRVVLWDVRSGQKRTLGGTGSDEIPFVVASANGQRFVTAVVADGVALRWDAVDGRVLGPLPLLGLVLCCAISPDGRQVLSGGADPTLGSDQIAVLWNMATGERVQLFRGHTKPVSAAAFSPDGTQALTGCWDGTVALWDVRTGRKLQTLQGHKGDILRVVFSPDARLVLSTARDETAVLWEARTGRKVRTFQGTVSFVGAFSPDGRKVLIGASKGAVLWDIENGQKLQIFDGKNDGVVTAAFSPEGNWIATGSAEGIALWEADTGTLLRTFSGKSRGVAALTFSSNGQRILSGGDGPARLWDVATGDELGRLFSLDEGREWLVVTPEGLFDGSGGGRQKVSYRLGQSPTVVPVDRFFQDFYRPGLLAALWRGERPMPDVQFAAQRPPTLRILSPKQGGPVEQAQVTLEVEAVDEGGDIKGPWLLHNGARVLASGQPSRQGNVLRRRFTVALVEGDNQLEVKAACLDGSWESEPARIRFQYARPLEKPSLHVVAAGINSYVEDRMNLRFARHDAQAMGELFAHRGKVLYKEVQVEQLLDAQVTRAGLRQALAKVAKQARSQDTVILFLAGHGTMVGQRYYFIPHDFKRSASSLEDDIRAQGLPGDDLGDYLAAVPALKRVLILDTCNSGGAVGLVKTGRNPFAFRGAIERLTHTQGVFTIAACAASDEAQEVAELGHGVLSYALLAGLRAVDRGPLVNQGLQTDNPERVAHIMEWFTYAAAQVPRLTRRYFGRVQEVEHRSQGQSFPILPVEER